MNREEMNELADELEDIVICGVTLQNVSIIRAAQSALRASAAPEEGMNHRTTAEPDQRSGHRSAEDTATTSELLPCPFCGSVVKVFVGENNFVDAYIGCDTCSASGPVFDNDPETGGFSADPRGDAIKHWNTRAASTVVDHQSDNSEPQEAVVPALAPATEDGGREEIAPHAYSPDAQAMGDCYVCGHNDPDRNLPWHKRAPSPSVGTGTQDHLRQIKAFASVINERNFLDIALHIGRQADEALAISSARREGAAE